MANRKRHSKLPERDLVSTIEQSAPTERILGFHSGGKSLAIKQAVKIRRIAIAVGIPMDEVMFSKFFQNFLGLQIMPWDTILVTQSTYLPEARNSVHNLYIDNPDSGDYLLMLDSDVLPPPDMVEKLMAHKLPIVGGWYRKKGQGETPVVYSFDKINPETGLMEWKSYMEPGEGLKRVDGAGAGAWLMRRDVATALGRNPYDMMRGGEDLDICLKIKDAGFDIFIDWSVNCAHAGVMYV